LFKHSKFVRISKGEQLIPAHFNEVVKHPQKAVFCASSSFSEISPLMPIDGVMNLEKYIGVIEIKIFPDIRRAFPHGGGIFQHGGD